MGVKTTMTCRLAVYKVVGAGDRIRTGDSLLGRQGLYR
jgi:hypothetical protein